MPLPALSRTAEGRDDDSAPVMSSPRLTSLSSVSDAPPQGASGLLSPCMSRHWSGTMYASAGTCSLARSPNPLSADDYRPGERRVLLRTIAYPN
jgi:hypothetical protein